MNKRHSYVIGDIQNKTESKSFDNSDVFSRLNQGIKKSESVVFKKNSLVKEVSADEV